MVPFYELYLHTFIQNSQLLLAVIGPNIVAYIRKHVLCCVYLRVAIFFALIHHIKQNLNLQ